MERSFFDIEFEEVKKNLLLMGGYVEKVIDLAIDGLIERKTESFESVLAIENKINELHLWLDQATFTLLAKQAPLASDLRLLVAVMRITTDLERMGDQAVNIARNGKSYIQSAPLKPLIDLKRMGDTTRAMVKIGLNSLVQQDSELAYEVLKKEGLVDALNQQIIRELITYMLNDCSTIQRALELIFISRNFERIADHATNIAEDVIFAIKGEDIRHPSLRERNSHVKAPNPSY